MTTSQDLLIIAVDVASSRPVEQGDLSLVLAGAELLDLLDAHALALDDEHIVPGPPGTAGDRLLDEAAAALVRQPPYEPVEDWLWRRGQGLAAAYRADARAGTPPARRRHRWGPAARAGGPQSVDSPARLRATARWTSGDPVLTALAAALGIRNERAEEDADFPDPVATVLAAVNGAVTELEAVRQKRSVEDAAFDNIWRAP